MKQKFKISIVFYMILTAFYLAFILCWIYILQTREGLDGQMITLQEAEKIQQFSTVTAISEVAVYLSFLVYVCYEWFAGNKIIKYLMKKGGTALILMALCGVAIITGYKVLVPSAEVLMNFFEPILGCTLLLILSSVLFGISKLFM